MTRTPETAAQLDRAIDGLLQGPVPVEVGELASTARLLCDVLPRLHPRFSFEEMLAARLLAAAGAGAPSDGNGARVVVTAPTPLRSTVDGASPAPDRLSEAVDRRRRSLLAGGAIASGISLAVPIAGAALVVWRRSRSPGGLP